MSDEMKNVASDEGKRQLTREDVEQLLRTQPDFVERRVQALMTGRALASQLLGFYASYCRARRKLGGSP